MTNCNFLDILAVIPYKGGRKKTRFFRGRSTPLPPKKMFQKKNKKKQSTCPEKPILLKSFLYCHPLYDVLNK